MSRRRVKSFDKLDARHKYYNRYNTAAEDLQRKEYLDELLIDIKKETNNNTEKEKPKFILN